MGNPAELLLQQFKAWSEPAATAKSSRGLDNDEREDALSQHVEAMEHIRVLAEIVDLLEHTGRRTDRYRRAIPVWTQAVLAFPHGWEEAGANAKLFPIGALDTLEGLADAIDHSVPALVAEPQSKAWAILEEISDLFSAVPDIDERLSAYAHHLLLHVRDCLNDFQNVGAFDLRESVMRLWVVLKAAEGDASKAANKSQFRSFAEQVWPATFAGLLSGIPQAGLAIAQLTQGG